MIAAKLIVWILAMLLCFFVPTPTPGSDAAYAGASDDLMTRVKSIRASLDGSKSEYLSAVQRTSELQAQSEELSAHLEEIRAQIADKRQDLANMLVQEYKSPTTQSFISAISEAGSLEEALRQFEYAALMAQSRSAAIAEVQALVRQANESMEEIEMKVREAMSASEEAEAAQSSWDEQLAELRPQVRALREKYWEEAASTSGSAQLEAAIAYLEDIDGVTDVQLALLRSAYKTGYAGADRCERWTENVYRNAGVVIGNYAGAAQDAQANMRSDDLDVIPVGALVFGSGSGSDMGRRYGHVGICVASGTGNGDALIIDNEGSKDKKAVRLDEWSEWQVSTSWVSGKQGAFGWGYPDSIKLDPIIL